MEDRINHAYPLAWDEVLQQTTPGTTVGRPHIPYALIAKVYVPDRPAAFADILNSNPPFYVPHYAPDPLRAVKLLRAAGGVPVLTHPATAGCGSINGRDLDDLVEAGLFGFESGIEKTPTPAEAGCAGKLRHTDSYVPALAFTTGEETEPTRGEPHRSRRPRTNHRRRHTRPPFPSPRERRSCGEGEPPIR